jgi:hypothetical protein
MFYCPKLLLDGAGLEKAAGGGGKQVENELERIRVQQVQRDVDPVLLQLWRGGEPKRNTCYFLCEAVNVVRHIEHLSYFRYYERCVTESELKGITRCCRNGWLGTQCKHDNVPSSDSRER